MKRTLFVVNVDNMINLITNSSSELFVMRGETEESVKEMVKAVYPDYEKEYTEPTSLKNSSVDDIESYMDWVEVCQYRELGFSPTFEQTKNWYIGVAERFAQKPEDFYDNWDEFLGKSEERWFGYASIKSEYYPMMANAIDPNGTIILMWSHDENPNWDMQEALMNIGDRYHLG